MGHHDPRLLYSIAGIKAYHLQHGEETELTPSGPQTLSLLMVPTSSPFADMGTTEEDFYLHLNLPPELDLPLPATTQIYHQPPRSYLIPRWDLGPDSGAFTRIEFPGVGKGPDHVSQEDVDTFETILAQCTAFLERAKAPVMSEKGGKGSRAYNPADFGPGEAYVPGTGSGHHGQIVLVDEENGSVIGELAEGNQLFEDALLRPGEKGTYFAIPDEIIVRSILTSSQILLKSQSLQTGKELRFTQFPTSICSSPDIPRTSPRQSSKTQQQPHV
jgi:spartin